MEKLVKLKPDFSYGDASLVYGQVLHQLNQSDRAKDNLEQHVRFWSHPQALLTLAQLYHHIGDNTKDRETIETMIIKIKSSTQFQYRQNKRYIHQGERFLAQLT